MNERERQFHDVFTAGGKTLAFEPATFRFSFKGKRARYTPDFYCPETGIFYELVGSRQAFYANRHRMAAFVKTYPTIKFEIVNPDGSLHLWSDDYQPDGPILNGENTRRRERPRPQRMIVPVPSGGDEMTSHEAAAILDVTRSAVLKLIQRGRLAAVRRGWQWFVAADEVARIAGEDLRTRDGRRAK